MIRRLISFIISKLAEVFKKNDEPMITEEELINYKQNFTGQSFQWIKTPDLTKLGKVVTCRDVSVAQNKIFAHFDDGSNLEASKVTNDMLMIHGDMKPLSQAEVKSIYTPAAPVAKPAKNINESHLNKENNTLPTGNPFDMFKLDKSLLNLKLSINLPNKKLLKMMYDSADDKVAFMEQLGDFIYSKVSKKSIIDSLSSMLITKPRKITKVDE